MTKTLVLIGALAALALPLEAHAQGRGRNSDGVPPGQRPPAGMCRIWIDGVPPGRQPAPTDCATAMRNRPSNARVLFGDDTGRNGKKAKGKSRNSGYSNDGRYDRREDRDRDGDYDRGDRSRTDDANRSGGYCADRDGNGVCDDRQGSQNRRTTSRPSSTRTTSGNDGWLGTVLDSARARRSRVPNN